MSDFTQPKTTAPAPDEPERRTDGLLRGRITFPGMLDGGEFTAADVDAAIESYMQRRATSGFAFSHYLWLTEGLEFDIQETETDESQ